jgi:hypothetical protein
VAAWLPWCLKPIVLLRPLLASLCSAPALAASRYLRLIWRVRNSATNVCYKIATPHRYVPTTGALYGVFVGVAVGVGPGQRLNGDGVGHGVHTVVATAMLTGQLMAGAISAVKQTHPGAAPIN